MSSAEVAASIVAIAEVTSEVVVEISEEDAVANSEVVETTSESTEAETSEEVEANSAVVAVISVETMSLEEADPTTEAEVGSKTNHGRILDLLEEARDLIEA